MHQNTARSTSEQAWPVPIPLDQQVPPPPFPVEALPGPIRKWVQAIAASTQSAPDISACMALAVVAGILSRRYWIKIRDGYVVPMCLYLIVLAESGEGKSPPTTAALAPLVVYENETNKRFLVEDVTPEAMARVLDECGGAIAQITDEGVTALSHISGLLYGNRGAGNFQIYLSGIDGKGFKVDRANRDNDPRDLPQVVITLALAMQPDVLRLVRDNGGLVQAAGFWNRPIYLWPQTMAGERDWLNSVAMPEDISREYANLIRRMAEYCKTVWTPRRIIEMEEAATTAIFEFRQDLEDRMREGGDLRGMKEWAGKLADATARIAGLLALVEVFIGSVPFVEPRKGPAVVVTVDYVERACSIADYAIEHAKRVFDPDEKARGDARALWKVISKDKDWIAEGRFKVRDLHKAVEKRIQFKERSSLDPGLRVLVEHRYLKLRKLRTGGRPSHRAYINPALLPSTKGTEGGG